MRIYNGDPYKTIAILGSFSKHYKDIVEAAKIFTENGFLVLVPKLDGVQEDSNEGFLLLIGDEDKEPKELEKDFLEKCLEADCVYVCDVDGYTGKTVMGELFILAAKGQEVYFSAEPEETLLRSMMSKSSPPIYSPIELVEMMKTHNAIYSQREWSDAYKPITIYFSFAENPKVLARRSDSL